MSEDANIRLENLKRLRLSSGDLKEKLGRSQGFWSTLLAGKKSFGEKLARSIEAELDYPRGWLDNVHSLDETPPPIAADPPPPPPESAIESLARSLEGLTDTDRERAVLALATMARAPDSRRARAALLAVLLGSADTAQPTRPFSEYALDVAKLIDAFPPGAARAQAHGAAIATLELLAVSRSDPPSTSAPTQPPAPSPADRQRRHR